MSNSFTYSVLRYSHSLLLQESLNIGVLFVFDQGNKVHFVAGNPQRIKTVYPSFDSTIFNVIVKGIRQKIDNKPATQTLFPSAPLLKELVHSYLLPEDSSAFQFSEPFAGINSFETLEKVVEEFSKLLLPETDAKRENRHNEEFLLKNYIGQLADREINVEYRMRKNQVIQIKGLKVNFDLSWKNGIVHLIKPISFDLKQESDIQNKSAQYFGYLDLLTEHAKRNGQTFDLLIGKPSDDKLQGAYEDALYILDRAAAPKELVTEDKLEDYTDRTAEILHGKES